MLRHFVAIFFVLYFDFFLQNINWMLLLLIIDYFFKFIWFRPTLY